MHMPHISYDFFLLQNKNRLNDNINEASNIHLKTIQTEKLHINQQCGV